MNRVRWEPVYIGVGSNLDEPVAQVERGLDALGALPKTRMLRVSQLVHSAPVGPVEQPDYVNAVAAMLTRLSPEELLAACQHIETGHGRRRDGPRWGPRTLDLDILLYGEQTVATQSLTVPHPELARRSFVLGPLMALAPRVNVPGIGRVAQLAHACDLSDLRAAPGAESARVTVAGS